MQIYQNYINSVNRRKKQVEQIKKMMLTTNLVVTFILTVPIFVYASIEDEKSDSNDSDEKILIVFCAFQFIISAVLAFALWRIIRAIKTIETA